MIHGKQKLELTYASVKEALTDYLQKHVAADVTIQIDEWTTGQYSGPSTQPLTVTFEQTQEELV